jgi:tetratricopeptide (TPR) repeat protein
MIKELSMKLKSATVLIVAVALVACGGPAERKARYRAKAQEYMQAGNYPKARVALRNVLKIDPKDADAYFLFAQVEEKEKNWRNAVGLYQEVVELVPNHTAALITLSKYYLEARLKDQVIQSAEKVLANDPQQPQAQALKIAASTIDGGVGAATVKAEALAGRFPTEPDVAILLATLYAQQLRFQEAIVVLQRAVDAHTTDLDLLNNLSYVFLQAKDMGGAERVARRMIEMEPTVFDHRLRLARLFDSQGDADKAEAVLREAVALDPQREERRLMLADFLGSRRNPRAAEQALLESVAQLPRSTKLQFELAAHYLKQGQAAEAQVRYMALAKDYGDKPAGLEAKVKLAELDLAAGRPEEAERKLQEVLKENPRSAEGLVLSGRMALARRNGKDAVQAFRTVLHDQPELATVHFLLGQAYQLTGELNLAKESLERAVALYPGQVDARRSLAALETQSGRPQQARARLEDLLKQRPDDVAALDMLMTLDLVTKNWPDAERMLERIRAVSKENILAAMAEGRLRQAQGRFDEAAGAFERAVGLAPKDPEPLLSLIKLQMALGHVDHAKTRLLRLVADQPGHLYGHGLLGEVLTIGGQSLDADREFVEATRINPRWVTPWLDWGTLWLGQKQPAKAVEIVQAGLKVNPESEELFMLMASAYSYGNQHEEAIAAYDGALRLNPRNVLAANNLAILLVDRKGDSQSLQRAFSLSRDFEKEAPHPMFLDTLGWVRFKMGHHEEALRLMKDAVAKLPEVPTLNYHLGIAFYHTGKTADARLFLSKALKSPEPFDGRQEAEEIMSQMRG